uniref:DUF834 domain-containing protein n=1 Tax=Oryza meridionalis TaxID=40149 RepID=A0A0E0F4P6_9ORYZ
MGDYGWEVRRRRIRSPLRAPSAQILRGSCTGDGGRGCDGSLRAGGKAAADRATAPPHAHGVTSAAANSDFDGYGGAAAATIPSI